MRKGEELTPIDRRHELTHCLQQTEILCVSLLLGGIAVGVFRICFAWILAALAVPFVFYFTEWLVRLCIDWQTAYKSISFEREAYGHEEDADWNAERTPFGWIKYWRKSK